MRKFLRRVILSRTFTNILALLCIAWSVAMVVLVNVILARHG